MTEIFKIIFLVLCITASSTSCINDGNIKNAEELKTLRDENEHLKKKIDSFSYLLDNENIEVIAFNNSHRLDLVKGDSIEFLFGLLYNRPNLASKLYLDIFTNKDSLIAAQNDPEDYSFMYNVDLNGNESVASTPLNFPYSDSDFSVVGGVFKLHSGDSIKYVPIKYNINEK